MKAMRRDNNIEEEFLNMPKKLVDSRALLVGCARALSSAKLKDAKQAVRIVHAIADAIEKTPAHNGNSQWAKLDTNPKGWKYCCCNCMQVAYMVPKKDGSTSYRFCPHCACIMTDEVL